MGIFVLETTFFRFFAGKKPSTRGFGRSGRNEVHLSAYNKPERRPMKLNSFISLFFCLFFFFGLAFVKRYIELLNLKQKGSTQIARRGYTAGDLSQIQVFGTCSSYLSVLVLALYIHSPKGAQLYEKPLFLWVFCPVLLYWVSRLWLLAGKGEVDEDPVLFTIKDKLTYLLGLLCLLFLILAGPK